MVTIATRFNGPAHSGNGGYSCGLIAAEHGHDGPTTVTLRLPPPLGVPLSWEHVDQNVRLITAGGAVVGEGTTGEFAHEPPAPVTPEQAEIARAAYPGLTGHPFSTCFTCGPDRADGDGLRIFTGPIAPGSLTTAAPWVPHHDHAESDGTVTTPIVWAAIDCAGGWTADFTIHPTVLGRMTGQILRHPSVGEECIVVGHQHAHEGRKFLTHTAVYSGTELLARSEQVWIEVDPTQFG